MHSYPHGRLRGGGCFWVAMLKGLGPAGPYPMAKRFAGRDAGFALREEGGTPSLAAII